MSTVRHLVWRPNALRPYTHHMLDAGDGTVYHWASPDNTKLNALIRRDPIEFFLREGLLYAVEYAPGKTLPPEVALERARSRLGEGGYDLIEDNCESFVQWCLTGEAYSEQVRTAVSVAGGTSGAAGATIGSVALVSAAGAVVGLSGPGVMSGLAAVGLGSGVIGGLGVLSMGPATVAVLATRKALADDPRLATDERKARAAGRAGSVLGAVAGTAGALASISAAGAASGLSAAGISSGLTAIGATVGGGMVAGTAVTVAAPAVHQVGPKIRSSRQGGEWPRGTRHRLATGRCSGRSRSHDSSRIAPPWSPAGRTLLQGAQPSRGRSDQRGPRGRIWR